MKHPLSTVMVEGAAKVNVGWRVGELRADGYHDVEGLIQTISLVDVLEIEAVEDGPLVSLEVPGHPDLETDANLVCAAAAALADAGKHGPVCVVLRKSIPVAAGLGGGSADAAAALVGLNALWGTNLPAKRLMELAGAVGSDVGAILRGGLVHVSGRGERVRGIGSFTGGCLVLGITHEGISAADAYATFDRIGGGEVAGLHHNDLELAACELRPGLAGRLEAMRAAAGVAFVSGSGPTVAGVCAGRTEAEAVAGAVRASFDDVLVALPNEWGVRLSLGS